MSKQCVIFSLLILSICYDKFMAADSPCGDWEPYKDEKCFKIIEKVGNEEIAENTCKQEENSANLITIHSKDEQDFLTNLLFKTHKIVDAVWIGAKYSSNKFKWIDDSDLSFTNWIEGSPSNTTDRTCVQMMPEGSSMGKWADEPCNKNNKVVCQKMQNWSLSRLQKTLLDARKELQDSLEDVRKQLKESQEDRKRLNSSLEDVKKNPVPIGFIYVQLPNEKSPTEIWPWMTWNDVSSAYAGVFFRITGGEAASFGQVQEDNTPRLSSVEALCNDLDMGRIDVPRSGWSGYVFSGRGNNGGNICTQRFQLSGGEVRPRNMAIRVWKRAS